MTALRFLLSQLFMVLLFLLVLVFSVPCSLFVILPYRYRYAVARRFTKTALWLLRVLCGIDYEVSGIQNLPDRACVVYCKHESVFETIAVTLFLPNLTWVLKRELMWLPFLGWALFSLQAIAINRRARSSAVQQVIDQGTRRLSDGIWVMIYPEGTRVMPGTSRRYGLSGALLARSAAAPIVPIALNSGDYWPRRKWLKRPGTIQVCVGPAIDAAGRDPEDVNAEAKRWIDAKVAELRVPDRVASYIEVRDS